MAKSEIPSIIVHSGGGNNSTNSGTDCGSSHGMERRQSGRPSRLAKQEEFDLEEEGCALSPVTIHIEDGGGVGQDDLPDDGSGREDCTREEKDEDDGSSDTEEMYRTQNNSSGPGSRQSPVSGMTGGASCRGEKDKAQSRTSSKGSPNRHRLGWQGSSQGSAEGSSPSLSRDSSTETYTDSTGIDLQHFIVETLHKNQKDRMMLLKIEQELVTFVKEKRQSYKFPQMSSYNRMLVHRVAAYFGLDHNVDQNGTAVIVTKTKNTRIPDVKFREQIRDELFPEEPKKSILKRDSASFEEGKETSPERQSSADSRRSKSFEEREEEYEKARARIFKQDQEGMVDISLGQSLEGTQNSSHHSSQEDLHWISEPRPWSSTDSDSSGRPPQGSSKLGSGSFDSESGGRNGGKGFAVLSKADSDTKEMLTPTRCTRPAMTKASSFGGISVLTREANSGNKGSAPRLVKAESFNATPSSSNSYPASPNMIPTQPTTSPNIATSSNQVFSTHNSGPAGCTPQAFPLVSGQPSPLQQMPVQQISSQPVWQPGSRDTMAEITVQTGVQPAVWSLPSVDSIPPGSVILNPQSGASYLNLDNVVYRHKAVSPTSTHPVLVAPFQQVVAPNPGPVPLTNQMPASLPSLPQQAPHGPQQRQPQQPTMPSTPTVFYIPCMAPPPQLALSQGPNPQQQGQPVRSDHRQYGSDGAAAAVSDLTAHVSALSFVAPQPLAQQSQDSGSPGGALGGISWDSVATPSHASHGFIAPGHGTQSFVPVYYMHQLSHGGSNQPVRYVYPGTHVLHAALQPSAVGLNTNMAVGGQGMVDLQGHSQVTPQPGTHSMASQQYVPGYQVFNYSQSGETMTSPSSPYYTYNVTPPASSTTATSTTTTSSVMAPPSGLSVPVYPYTGMVLTGVANGSTMVNPSATSQANQAAGYLPSVPVAAPAAALPMYVVAANNASAPPTPPGGNLPGTLYTTLRPQTPPTQNAATHVVPNQSVPLNSPLVSYALYAPSLQSSHIQQASAASAHPPSSSPQYTPAIMTAFHILRPGIPVVGGVRNNTPPPQNMMPPQFPTPPPSASKGSMPFAVPRPGDGLPGFLPSPARDCSPDLQKGVRAPPLHMGAGSIRTVPTAPLYRRDIPLMHRPVVGKDFFIPSSFPPDVRLLGHPLQHQINSMVLPQQRPLARFPHHQPGTGHSIPHRPPKMRKQRNKGGSANPNSGGSKGEAGGADGGGGNHVLEVEGLPEGMKRNDVERYLEQVTSLGAKIHFISVDCGGSNYASPMSSDLILSSKYQVLAVFDSDTAAQSAMLSIKTTKFQLRPLRRGGGKDGSKGHS